MIPIIAGKGSGTAPKNGVAQRLRLANLPTPIQELRRLSAMLGGPRLFVKRDDLTGLECSGNKIRKLEYIASQALSEGCSVLITCGGLQSNHARATAAVAARLGLSSHLVLSGQAPEAPNGNYLLDVVLGAHCTFVPGAELDGLHQKMEEIAGEYRRAGKKAMIVPLGASNPVGANGYVHAAAEMSRQFAEQHLFPDYIVAATGSGGTQAGLILGKELHGLACKILGINVRCDEAYFVREIGRIIEEYRACYGLESTAVHPEIQIIDGYVGEGYGKSTPDLLRLIALVGRTEGIILDPTYTGKAFYGLCREIEKGRFRKHDTILFIHTGGIFGLFPYGAELTRCHTSPSE